MAAGKKESLRKWLANGKATYPLEGGDNTYSFWAGSMNFADTVANGVVGNNSKNTNWIIPRPFLYGTEVSENYQILRNNTLGALKWVDAIFPQFFSGSLLFGAIQNGGEYLRASGSPISGIILGTIGRFGLFFSQIIAGAIRLPLAIISGSVGLVVGFIAGALTGQSIPKYTYAGMVDFIWPFAPKTANLAAFGAAASEGHTVYNEWSGAKIGVTADTTQAFNAKKQDSENQRNITLLIGAISLVIAVTMVALLATGTLGGGLSALPLIPQLSGFIATGLNFALGWAGFTVATGTAAVTATPIIAIISTMLVGAFTTFISSAINTFKDNIIAPKDSATNSGATTPSMSGANSNNPASSTGVRPSSSLTPTPASPVIMSGGYRGSQSQAQAPGQAPSQLINNRQGDINIR